MAAGFTQCFHMFKGHTAPLRWEWWSWFSMSAWSHHVATWEKTIDTSGVVSSAQCLPSTTRHLFDTRGVLGKFLMLTWACQLLRGPTGWFRAVLLGREGWKTNQEPPLSCREPLHERNDLCYITVWSSLEHLSWYQRWNCKIRRKSLQIPSWCIYSNLIAHQNQRGIYIYMVGKGIFS